MAGKKRSAVDATTLWPYVARSVERLLAVMESLPDEERRRWRPPVAGSNSVAALVTHLLGNLRRNMLGVIGGDTIPRDRRAEFEGEPLTLAEANDEWARLRFAIEAVLASLGPDGLLGSVRHDHRGDLTRLELLFVAGRHAAEHLGQAELTRDLALAALAARNDGGPPREGG